MSATVDTRSVAGRRRLRLAHFDDVRRDLDRLEAAAGEGTLRALGNWTPGQVFAHLAAFLSYPYEGYPAQLSSPPWLVRAVSRLLKRRFIRRGFPPGVKIPRVEGGTTGAEKVALAEGLGRLRRALDRMEREAPRAANPVLGPLTHDEWMQLNCRHAELHLSFLQIGG